MRKYLCKSMARNALDKKSSVRSAAQDLDLHRDIPLPDPRIVGADLASTRPNVHEDCQDNFQPGAAVEEQNALVWRHCIQPGGVVRVGVGPGQLE